MKSPLPAQDQQQIKDALRRWRDDLVSLSASNRLLNLNIRAKSVITIENPPNSLIIQELALENAVLLSPFRFRALLPEEDTQENEASEIPFQDFSSEGPSQIDSHVSNLDDHELCVRLSPASLGAALRLLQSRTKTDFLDSGVWTLHLALGMLHWNDGTRDFKSPLLLIPTTLEGDGRRSTPTLSRAGYDVVINPALALKLLEYGIRLPEWDSFIADQSISESTTGSIWDRFFAEVLEIMSKLEGCTWELDDKAFLSYFNFNKIAMYRDLIDNESQILASPHIAALAKGGSGEQNLEMRFDPIEPHEIDAKAPIEFRRFILDADSSQRACIEAAIQGHSFTVQGPPGTGKSQTITNMIASLIAEGKSVLFVSEKAAALEVVRNRLAAAHLLPYVLELHSAKTKRSEVAAALGTALNFHSAPNGSVSPEDVENLSRLQARLTEYAEAVNTLPTIKGLGAGDDKEASYPLGRTVIQVIGRVETLNGFARVPGLIDARTLTSSDIAIVRQAAEMLVGAWGPVSQGDTYLWHGVDERQSLAGLVYQTNSSLGAIAADWEANLPLVESLGITEITDMPYLLTILEHLDVRPSGIPDAWFSLGEDPVSNALEAVRSALEILTISESRVVGLGISDWRIFAEMRLPDYLPSPILSAGPAYEHLNRGGLKTLSKDLATHAERLEKALSQASNIAQYLEVAVPSSTLDCSALMELVINTQKTPRPIAGWLTRDGCTAGSAAVIALRIAFGEAISAAEDALKYFTQDCLKADIQYLSETLRRKPGLLESKTEYRQAKNALANISIGNASGPEQVQRLALVQKWQQAIGSLNQAIAQHATSLGQYYEGHLSDWANIALGIRNAELLLASTDDRPSRAVVALSLGTVPSEPVLTALRDVTKAFEAWKSRIDSESLPSLPADSLSLLSVMETIKWLRHHAAQLDIVAGHLEHIEQALGRPVSLAEGHEILLASRARAEAQAQWVDAQSTSREVLDFVPHGTVTEIMQARQSLDWVAELKALIPGSTENGLSPQLVTGINSATPLGGIPQRWQKWLEQQNTLLSAFNSERVGELKIEFSSWETARSLLEEMAHDPQGQDQWFRFLDNKKIIEEKGLGAGLEEAFSLHRQSPDSLNPEDLPDILERAMLTSWLEHIFRTTPGLIFDTDDHNRQIENFCKLDRRLITAANLDIINAANGHRPKSPKGVGAQAILAESKKKARHKPVRDLIGEAQDIITKIQPVMMMSPLSVSQYLPPEMRFDVVIFDEASQVLPGDAINCIYRGRQIIIVGDEKQLPPWTGFENQDERDYESILSVALGCGAYENIPLLWHYRSRHEDLITYSKKSFYHDLPMVTFPAAKIASPDLGVEFFHVKDGLYDRGSTRPSNMPEAWAVGDRVLHHIRTRPHMTLGVVTFSLNQAEAVMEVLDQLRAKHRDLDSYLSQDQNRLSGFFVKSLESVQGDERDVMIFSIGYGPDGTGKITQNFGPLNREGGWRRLNVAVTRARHRNEIVSSLRASDVKPAGSESLSHFQRFLDYAERGPSALNFIDNESLGSPDSPFEEAVLAEIRSFGYECVPQVGSAGFRIDIGVRHPDYPETFMVGVECDGATYHSSPAARDRDRLRQEVLEGLGWTLYRIWSTNWFRHRGLESERLKSTLAALREGEPLGLTTRISSEDRPAIGEAVTVATEYRSIPEWVTEYEEADLPRPRAAREPGSHYAISEYRKTIQSIVDVEGPIHLDLLDRRIRDIWAIGRIGPNIRARIDESIKQAIENGEVEAQGEFLLASRNKSNVARTRGPRKTNEIYPEEISAVIMELISDAVSIQKSMLISEVVEHYGSAKGGDFTDAVRGVVEEMQSDGRLAPGDVLKIPSSESQAVD